MSSTITGTPQVSIFWDYERCPPPDGLSGNELVNNIRKSVQDSGHIKSFKAYFDISSDNANQRSACLLSELQSSGVTLVHCPHNVSSDAGEKMMIVDMLAFALDNSPPAPIVIITGDRSFTYAGAILRRRGYRITVIAPQTVLAISNMQADELIDWEDNANVSDVAPLGVNGSAARRKSEQREKNAEPTMLDLRPSSSLLSGTDSGLPQIHSFSRSERNDAFKERGNEAPTAHPISICPTTSRSVTSHLDPISSSSIETPSDVSSGTKSISTSQTDPTSNSEGATGTPDADSITRFRPLIDVFAEERASSGLTQFRSSYIASKMLKRDAMAYERAGVRRMKQYVEEARLANVLYSSGDDGDSWIEMNESLYRTLQRPAVTAIFEPLVDRLRAADAHHLLDFTLETFFKEKHPQIYEREPFSQYLERAEAQGIVRLRSTYVIDMQWVELAQALRDA